MYSHAGECKLSKDSNEMSTCTDSEDAIVYILYSLKNLYSAEVFKSIVRQQHYSHLFEQIHNLGLSPELERLKEFEQAHGCK